jgi:hypothetical protein
MGRSTERGDGVLIDVCVFREFLAGPDNRGCQRDDLGRRYGLGTWALFVRFLISCRGGRFIVDRVATVMRREHELLDCVEQGDLECLKSNFIESLSSLRQLTTIRAHSWR